MTDPISSVVRLQPVPSTRRAATPDTDAAVAAAPIEPAPVAPPPTAPLALSMDRDPSGVFVYTLTDSASGRVVAVIPRSAVVSASARAAQGGVDLQA